MTTKRFLKEVWFPLMVMLFLTADSLIIAGCTAFSHSPVPTPTETKFFDITTNYVPRVVFSNVVVMVTNTVPVTVTSFDTNHVAITVTNLVPTTVLQTNVVGVTVTNTTYTLAPNATAKAVGDTAGLLTNIGAPGAGGIATGIVGGLYALWARRRNSIMAGQNDALTASSQVLAQIIETGRELLATTPQGQKAADAFTTWMIKHQAETKTISSIAGIVENTVNNQDAKQAAIDIQAIVSKP